MQETLETQVPSLGREDPKEMATTPISMPGKFHGQRSLAGYVCEVAKSRTHLSTHAALYLITPLPSPFPKLYKIIVWDLVYKENKQCVLRNSNSLYRD